jgi:hypothetical protein
LTYLVSKALVALKVLLYLLTGVDDGGVVSAAELLPYRRIRDVEVLSQEIHDDLAGLDDLLSPRLLVDTLFFYGVEVGDDLHNIFDSHRVRLGFAVCLIMFFTSLPKALCP